MIPLFPELRPYLEEAWEQAAEGTEHVIARYRNKNANLRTQLLRIIERAREKSWPKLFQNLRSSRETELTEQYPVHVVCAWIGNSERIAAKHYLQVTDDHFGQAAKSGAESVASNAQTEQNAVQQRDAESRDDSQKTQKAPGNTEASRNAAIPCVTVPDFSVPPRGVEPLSSD